MTASLDDRKMRKDERGTCRVCGWTTPDGPPFAQAQAAQHLDTMSDDPKHKTALGRVKR